ncbi:MAG: hypothetical protein PHU44_14850 [Syntrophales bacterium]|nr:hypothetical protein [Syntrophales bacterium]
MSCLRTVAAICCRSCHCCVLEPSPYCSICGQLLVPGSAVTGSFFQSPGVTPRFLMLEPELFQDRETGLIWQRGAPPDPSGMGKSLPIWSP